MAPHVNHRGTGSIGNAQEIYQIISQRFTDLVEIVHGDWGGIEPKIGLGLDFFAEALDRSGLKGKSQKTMEHFIQAGELAGQRVGAAGASLINEDYVPFFTERFKSLSKKADGIAGALAGAAAEKKHGIGSNLPTGRGENRDVQLDPAAAAGVSVFVDRIRAAQDLFLNSFKTAPFELDPRRSFSPESPASFLSA
jgi:hypothetical protein